MNTGYPWQQRQWKRLAVAHANDRVPHALLLAGPAGLGIDEFSLALAGAWLCTEPGQGGACGTCRSCQLYQAGNHPDLARLIPEEEGKQIKVEDVRELVRFMQLRSQNGRGKIALISPAEAMNRSAANALLKILEEPPAGGIFILVSNRPEWLPVTVRSRCQRIDFRPDQSAATTTWLAQRLAIDQAQALDALMLARGCPLLAVTQAENDTLTRQTGLLAELANIDGRPADITAIAQRWQESGTAEVFGCLLQFLAAMTRMKIAPDRTIGTGPGLNRDLQRLANRLDLQALMRGYEVALQNYRAVTGPYNLNQTGLLEQFIVFWQSVNRGARP